MADAAQPFELPIKVAAGDIDELGHVNNVTYLRWVQDAAVAHWTAAAPADEQARLFWIVLRHEIEYLHPAHMEDLDALALRPAYRNPAGLPWPRLRPRAHRLVPHRRRHPKTHTRQRRMEGALLRARYFAGVSPRKRSLLILSTTPAFRSATSLTLYSADVPSTCATSDPVSL